MPCIIVLSSGDGTGLNFTRCLHRVGGWRVIGVDDSLADYHGSEADERHLVRWDTDEELLALIHDLARRHQADLLYAADTGRALNAISHLRDRLNVPTFLPDLADHLRMEDKWLTWQALDAVGLPTPDTALVDDRDVVQDMLSKHGRVWLRRRTGSAGSGAVATDSLAFASAWLDREDGWGSFTVAQCLSARTATLSALWHDGQLVASQLRERLGWRYPSLSASGVTGITGGQRTSWDPQLHELALACVRALSRRPHGAIGVDFTYDSLGQPLPTEVQPARFYSSMQFLAEAGLNLPALYCRTATEGPPPGPPLMNPIRDEKYWVKGVEKLPTLLTAAEYFVA